MMQVLHTTADNVTDLSMLQQREWRTEPLTGQLTAHLAEQPKQFAMAMTSAY